jgi:hypothetical protein
MPREHCGHTLVHKAPVIRLLPVFFPLGYDTRPLGITFASCRSMCFFDCGSWCYPHPVTPSRRLLSSDMLVCVCHEQRLQPFGVVIADPICAYVTLHTRSMNDGTVNMYRGCIWTPWRTIGSARHSPTIVPIWCTPADTPPLTTLA